MVNIFSKEIDSQDYIIAEYYLKSSRSLEDAALNLAIGQSFGNPSVRSKYETYDLIKNHSCLILEDQDVLKNKKEGKVKIAFPAININIKEDGISHLLCQLMGGQLDIDSILKCHLLSIEIPEVIKNQLLPPKYGLSGFREYVQSFNKPLVGGIIKPKIGFNIDDYEKMLHELIVGGVDFIKEDEIIADPIFCGLKERVKIASKVRSQYDKNVVIAHTINADPNNILNKTKMVAELGGNGVHINVWCGYGAYRAVRELDLPLFLHFQKSGDKIITSNDSRFYIDWSVICHLAGLSGVDFIHAGMWGGYSNDNESDLSKNLDILRSYNVTPALSCGMHPGLIQSCINKFGVDYLANSGGAIHGHPNGTTAGAKALRDAVDNVKSNEYLVAIEKWGLV